MLARVSHAIKGTAGLVAAENLRSIAARMEEIARSRTLEFADALAESEVFSAGQGSGNAAVRDA